MNATHTFQDSFLYEQSDVPPGESLREWRKGMVEARRPRRPSLKSLFLAPPRQLTVAR